MLMSGSRCAHIWQPDNWASRERSAKTTVVLNVWADHVSTYQSDVGGYAPHEPTEQTPWPQHLLAAANDDDDVHK